MMKKALNCILVIALLVGMLAIMPQTASAAVIEISRQTPLQNEILTRKAGHFSTISLGGEHFCAAISSSGELFTWGLNYGRLGLGDDLERLTPTKVLGITNTISVSLGSAHGAAVSANGTLYSWGYNGYGQLGISGNDRKTPQKVSGLGNVVSVSSGGRHTAALTDNGDLYMWGDYRYGQLGDGTSTDSGSSGRYKPVKVAGLSNVVAVDLGERHSVAITVNGDIYTWGCNDSGQLGYKSTGYTVYGDDQSPYTATPTKVPGLSNIIAISANNDRTAAIASNGDLYIWGGSYYKYESAESGIAIKKISNLTNVVDVSIGYGNYAAITANGDLYIWGDNTRGQLGQGFISGGTDVPTKVSAISNVTSVCTDNFGIMAITSSGDLYTWGFNYSGQVGDSTKENRSSPIKVMSNVLIPEDYAQSVLPVTLEQPQSIQSFEVTPIADLDNTNITVGNKLSWNSIPGASKYDVYRSLPGEAPSIIGQNIAGNSFVDLNIEPDTEYTYIVCPEGKTPDAPAASGKATAKTGTEAAPLLPDKDGNMGKANSYILMQIENPMMSVNGENVEVDPGRGTAPVLRKDRTMVPIRAIIEAMDGIAEWGDAERKATLKAIGSVVEMWIDKYEYMVNGAKGDMDVAPFLENGRTFLPLRFVAENLNCRVTWINKTKEILFVFNSGS